ncbi:MAG TPA: hypothetical protein VMY37_31725 [Thermoguttaceae bacterium]|nr:hypothetical protein [Thermoguttaceae bacterium]
MILIESILWLGFFGYALLLTISLPIGLVDGGVSSNKPARESPPCNGSITPPASHRLTVVWFPPGTRIVPAYGGFKRRILV